MSTRSIFHIFGLLALVAMVAHGGEKEKTTAVNWPAAGFEKDGWNVKGSVFSISSVDPRNGTKCLQVEDTGTELVMARSQVLPAVGEAVYRLNFFARVRKTSKELILFVWEIDEKGKRNQIHKDYIKVSVGKTWQPWAIQFTLSPGMKSIQFGIQSYKRTILAQLDDFSLVRVNLPRGNSTSELWGEKGEKWTPASRLPEFSYAGYHFGEDPIPDVPVTANVKDFGAKGDGKTDDTEAFLKAIMHTAKGAILIPEGRYVINRVLKLNKSGLVLRGEGQDKTVLYFPQPLGKIAALSGIKRNKPSNALTYSWTGGVIWAGVDLVSKSKVLATVKAPVKRGSRALALSSTDGLKAGQTIRLVMYDKSEKAPNGLIAHLYAGKHRTDKNVVNWRKGKAVDWTARIEKVDGQEITLLQPLRTDVRLDWQPEIHSFTPTVSELGIEHLRIEFPSGSYKGHFREKGFNGITFSKNCAHCWVRDVTVVDSDSALFLEGARHCTVDGFRMTGHSRKGITGHHGIEADGCQDCLITRFNFETRFIHDITFQVLANGNVFSKGKGVDINFDHHGEGPYENLCTEIHVGTGRRLWKSSGRRRGGARETFWNLWMRTIQKDLPHWPQVNLIGVRPATWKIGKKGAWVEIMDPAAMQPRNIYEAQKLRRKREGKR